MVEIQLPVLIINYKTYKEGAGPGAQSLTEIVQKVALGRGASVAIVAQPPDIYPLSNRVSISVLAQHIGPVGYGSHTGHILPEAAKAAGAAGTLINHSEHRMRLADISEAIKRAKEVGIETVVCANDVPTAGAIACLKPDFVAVEPPELIGGDVSVSKAKPEVITGTVEAVKRVDPAVRVLCGAGVKSGVDVAKAIEMGSQGVLLASGVVRAKDPRAVMRDLIDGLMG